MAKRKIFAFLLALVLSLALVFSFAACGEENRDPTEGGGPTGNTNNDPYCIAVDIKSEPTKLDYFAGELFSPSGLLFDATFMIDGKEEVITNMTYTDCTYTNKGVPLTADVDKIEFDCFTFKFSIDITVTDVSYTGIEVSLNDVPGNVFTGETVDLTKLEVKALTADDEVVLPADSYTLTDNGKQITPSQYYELTKGAHVFEASFLTYKDSVTVTAWDEADMTLTGITVDTSGIGKTFVVQEYVNLTKARVIGLYESKDGTEVALGKEITGWTIKKKDGSEIENPAAYQLENALEEFTVTTADGKTAEFSLSVVYYDQLEVARRDGTTTATVTKNSNFATAYIVKLRVKGSDKETEVNPAQYTITAVRDGVTIENATTENVFAESGTVTVTVSYFGMKQAVTVNVLDGYVVYTKDHIKTADIQADDKNFVEIPAGTTIKSENPNDNGYEYIGDVNESDVLIFHIWSEVAGKANVVVNASSTVKTNISLGQWRPTETADLQFNTVMEVYKGRDLTEENKYDIPDTVMLPGFVSQKVAYEEGDPYATLGLDDKGRAYDHMVWTNWQPVNVGTIDLVEGDNIVTLRYCGGSGDGKCNIYSLEVQLTEA